MTLSRDQIVITVKQAAASISKWEASDAPNVNWRGATVKAVSEPVLQSLDAICALAHDEHVDPDGREIVMVIDEVEEELIAWAEAIDAAPEAIHPGGNRELWAKYRALLDAIKPRLVKLPEGINELVEHGVGDQQIARMYGFLHDDGSPDVTKLAEEKREPGTHFDPKTWVPPHIIRHQAEIDVRWEQRAQKLRDYRPLSVAGQDARPKYEAPESLEELIGQGVSAEQIARMKRITVEQVYSRASELGVALDGKAPRSNVDRAKRELEKQAAGYEQSHPDIGNRDDRIIAMHLDGKKPKEISDALKPDYPDLTWQQVTRVTAEAKKQEEAASAD